MPVADSQTVYPPYEGQPIDTTWGVGVAESVVQKFDSIPDRTAKWTTPPNGAMSAVRNIHHTVSNSTWIPTTVFSDYQFGAGGWGSGQPGFQAYDQIYTLQPCPYPCVISVMADSMLWVAGNGDMDVQVYSNQVGAPNGAGWISRCGIRYVPSGTYHQQSTTLVMTKTGQPPQQGAHFNEGDVPQPIVRIAFTHPNIGWWTHLTAFYLPAQLQVGPP